LGFVGCDREAEAFAGLHEILDLALRATAEGDQFRDATKRHSFVCVLKL
jgi:hypothetical protein